MAKKVLIVGATGGTGRSLVEQALTAGHSVTAFVRNPEKVGRHHERLRVVAGDAASGAPSLSQAMRGQDAVISALGRGQSFKADSLIQRSVPHLLAAMQEHGVRRLVFTSALGVAETVQQIPLMMLVFARLLLRDIYADKAAGEALIRRSGLEWTIVHPAGLTNGPLTGTYRAGERLALRGFPTISRADTAHFLISQLDDRSYIGKVVVIAT
ncbi:MAG TPA: NAD(P)-binding oxidoreductase [Vicinamibacterales bacterium]|jgi:putative NADH-flavin reductase|nr:NAD(P)-binding oxidoreductase [Vicinamibacterales bacterium]